MSALHSMVTNVPDVVASFWKLLTTDRLCRGNLPLPLNFEYIALDKKAIVKLRSLGIQYEQDAIRTRSVLDE